MALPLLPWLQDPFLVRCAETTHCKAERGAVLDPAQVGGGAVHAVQHPGDGPARAGC